MKNISFHLNRKLLTVFVMILALSLPALAQKIAVHGMVVDQTGEPLIGATVQEKGTSNGTAADFDGRFELNVAPNATLLVSYVGYDPAEVAVNGRTEINVTLKENSTMLNETVVIGYGSVKKSDATGSVAVINPDEVEAGLATSAQDLLVGASPGVVVTTDGNPSGGASIQIRGGASLAASNDPLIVIDGVPMDTKGVTGSSNPLALVSPENVESMTILKDASATAIYGSRASNGVIIITTKKGKSGRPQVNVAINAYVNTPSRYLDLMNGDQFRSLVLNQYGEGSNQASGLGTYNTNWMKEAMHTTFSTDYAVSVGGSLGNVPYRVSATYTNNNGILRHTGMDRTTASINLSPTFFGGILSINANVKGAYLKNYYTNNRLSTAAAMNPTLPVRDFENGSPAFGYWTSFIGDGSVAGPDASGMQINGTTAPINPISEMDDYRSKGEAYQSIGNLQIDFKMPFLTDLRANLNLGYDYQHGRNKSYYLPFTPKAWLEGYQIINAATQKVNTIKDGGTSATLEKQRRLNLLLDFYLNYNHDWDVAALDVTAGYSWQKFDNSWRKHVYVNTVGDEANAGYIGVQANPTEISVIPVQLVSFFGRANLSFLNRYLITATVRGDGTSRFSKSNRWGVFPSVALGWKLLEEPFMEPARSVMSEFKIRAGYGVTGQQDLGDDYYLYYLPVYNQWTGEGAQYPGLNGNGYIKPLEPSSYNTNLKWEETHTWNAGIDFGFLNNRIAGAIEFYKRTTKDLLTKASYPAGSNLTNQGPMNIGDLENIGLEFTINTRPVVTRDVTWTSALNVAWNKNKITRLAEGADTRTGDISIGKGNKVQKHEVGHPAFSFYVFEQVYDENGDPLQGVFVDRDGDGQITDADKYLYHSKDPKVTLTWNNQVSYRNWDFGIVLRSNIGNWVYNDIEVGKVNKNNIAGLPLENLMNNRFLFESIDDTQGQSDYFVRNASFLRCDNITVGYTWPSLIKGNLRLRLYGAVQNPFVITKYKGLDPEISSGIDRDVYPRPLTVNVGIVANF